MLLDVRSNRTRRDIIFLLISTFLHVIYIYVFSFYKPKLTDSLDLSVRVKTVSLVKLDNITGRKAPTVDNKPLNKQAPRKKATKKPSYLPPTRLPLQALAKSKSILPNKSPQKFRVKQETPRNPQKNIAEIKVLNERKFYQRKVNHNQTNQKLAFLMNTSRPKRLDEYKPLNQRKPQVKPLTGSEHKEHQSSRKTERLSKTKTSYMPETKTPEVISSSMHQEQLGKRQDRQAPVSHSLSEVKQFYTKQLDYEKRNKRQELPHPSQIRVSYADRTMKQHSTQQTPEALTVDLQQLQNVRRVTAAIDVMHKTKVITPAEGPVFRQEPVFQEAVIQENISHQAKREKPRQAVYLPQDRRPATRKVEYQERTMASDFTKVSQSRLSYQKNQEQTGITNVNPPSQISIPNLVEEPVLEKAGANASSLTKQQTTHVAGSHMGGEALTPKSLMTEAASLPENQNNLANKIVTTGGTPQAGTKFQQRTVEIASPGATVFKGELMAFKKSDYSGDIKSIPSLIMGSKGKKSGPPKIEFNLPPGLVTDQQLYNLTGTVRPGAKTAFLTVNDTTQLVNVTNGNFQAEVALLKGVNNIKLQAFNNSGEMAAKSAKLLLATPTAIPFIKLETPENGRQGAKEGDLIIVEGTVNDLTIKQAVLLLNQVPIKLKIKNGRFRRKIFLPPTRITTFRITAKNEAGVMGYSALHTVLSGYEIDISNPRPY